MSTPQCLQRASMDVDSITTSSNVTEVPANIKDEAKFGDPLQSHEPSQNKELSPEALRVSRVLENCIRQVKFAATLPALLQLNRESAAVDKELSRALQEHQVLVDRLEMQEGLKKEPQERQDDDSRKGDRARLQKDIKASVRGLLRLIKARPDAVHGCMEAGQRECMLIRVLEKFHGDVVENLLTSDEEPQLAPQEQMSSSHDHELELLVSEEKKVATLMAKTDAEISTLSEEIMNLQSSLEENNKYEVDFSYAEKQCRSLMEASKVKQNKTRQEIDQMNTKFNNAIKEFKQVERVLREKNEKVKAEIEHLVQKFDEEIMETQADLELNEMHYEKEEDELREMAKPFSLLEQEYNQILERRRLAEEMRKEEMRELELKTRAAIFAQAWWRGYSTRKALKNKGKGKKAKKGKGKK